MQNFGRYEVILNRRPFGEAPSEAELAAARPVVPAGPSFADSLQLCAITAGGGAIRVGFLDVKTKPPKTYFLFVGESEDGIEVVDADYDAETALLRKAGEERTLRMSHGSTSYAAGNDVQPSLRKSHVMKKNARAERLRKLRQRQFERTPLLKGEELEEHVRAYNMDLIRAGGEMGVPLPIALTHEEDEQLVAEGVLAPPSN